MMGRLAGAGAAAGSLVGTSQRRACARACVFVWKSKAGNRTAVASCTVPAPRKTCPKVQREGANQVWNPETSKSRNGMLLQQHWTASADAQKT